MNQRQFRFTELLFLIAAIFFSTQAWAQTARITHVTVSNATDMTHIAFEISDAPFHYHWQLSNDKKKLTLHIDPALLATILPDITTTSSCITHYENQINADKNIIQFIFELQPNVHPSVYTLPGSDSQAPTLIIDFQFTTPPPIRALPPKSSAKTNPYLTSMSNQTSDQPSTESKDVHANSYASIMDENPDANQPPKPFYTENTQPKIAIPQEKNQEQLPTKKINHAEKTNADSIHHPIIDTIPLIIDQKSSTSKPIMVVIDPGHGGKDSGAIGPNKTMEKNVVLAISKRLQKRFNEQLGFKAELTRDTDKFIPLHQRLSIARKCKADLFIAIHADSAYQNTNAVGATVFALSTNGATSEMAHWMAKKENSSEFIYGITVNNDRLLRSVLLDLSQTHMIDVSLKIGQQVLNQLNHVTTLHDKQVEQAAFVVLKSPDIPSLLIETAYISNPTQEKKLCDPIYQQQLTDSIARGVINYFNNDFERNQHGISANTHPN